MVVPGLWGGSVGGGLAQGGWCLVLGGSGPGGVWSGGSGPMGGSGPRGVGGLVWGVLVPWGGLVQGRMGWPVARVGVAPPIFFDFLKKILNFFF